MSPHGPDLASYQAASAVDTGTPQRLGGSWAFMFEVSATPRVMRAALKSPLLEQSYQQIWSGFPVAELASSGSKRPAENGTSLGHAAKVQKREAAAETVLSTG